MAVSGPALAAVAVGSALVYAGVKGISILSAAQDLVTGNKPTDVVAYPLSVEVAQGVGTAPDTSGVSGRYDLGPVKPHVESAAYEIGPMFGISSIGGWRASDPFPDHPSGLALDFMTSDRATGDALSAYVIANARRLRVKYIIWNHRTWNVTRGTWAPYTSTSNPHTDHVHVTFYG